MSINVNFIKILKNVFNKDFVGDSSEQKKQDCLINSINLINQGFPVCVKTYFNNYDEENPSFDIIIISHNYYKRRIEYFVSLRIANNKIQSHYFLNLKFVPDIMFKILRGPTKHQKLSPFCDALENAIVSECNNGKYTAGNYGSDNIYEPIIKEHHKHNKHHKYNKHNYKNEPYYMKDIRHLPSGETMSCLTYKLCLHHTNIGRKKLDWLRANGFTIDGTPYAGQRATIQTYIQPIKDKINKFSNNSFCVDYKTVNELRKKSWRLYYLIKNYNKSILHTRIINNKEYLCIHKCIEFSSYITSIAKYKNGVDLSGKKLLMLLHNINIINDIELCENNGSWQKKHNSLINKLKSAMKVNMQKIRSICHDIYKNGKKN